MNVQVVLATLMCVLQIILASNNSSIALDKDVLSRSRRSPDCDYIEIRNAIHQTALEGVYHKLPSYPCSGRPSYGQQNGNNYLYYFAVYGQWMVGPAFCTHNAGIYAQGSGRAPDRVTSMWMEANVYSQWQWSPGLSVNCINLGLGSPISDLGLGSPIDCDKIEIRNTKYNQATIEGVYQTQPLSPCNGRSSYRRQDGLAYISYVYQQWIIGLEWCTHNAYVYANDNSVTPDKVNNMWVELNAYRQWENSPGVSVKCHSAGSGSGPVAVLPTNCGRPGVLPRHTRIVGGTPAVAHSYPWQISLLKDNEHWCGGSIIASQYIVTAAHCVDNDGPSNYKVRIGEHDLSTWSPNEKDIQVIKITRHPNYIAITTTNDIAILKLAQDISFNRYAFPVCLPTADPNGGQYAIVTGWGRTSFFSSGPTQVLQQVRIPIVPQGICQQLGLSVSDDMICAGENGKDSCKGDSGGPLVYRRNHRYELVGVVSWGIACGIEGTPGVYARVTHFNDWIKNNMN